METVLVSMYGCVVAVTLRVKGQGCRAKSCGCQVGWCRNVKRLARSCCVSLAKSPNELNAKTNYLVYVSTYLCLCVCVCVCVCVCGGVDSLKDAENRSG